MKPNKVGISLQNAYAYVLFGSLKVWGLGRLRLREFREFKTLEFRAEGLRL